MDCSPPVFSHGIFKARILEWVAVSFSRRSSPPRDQTQVSRNIGRRFTVWATRVLNKLLSDNYYLINWDKRNSLNSPFLPAVTLDYSWGDRVLNSCSEQASRLVLFPKGREETDQELMRVSKGPEPGCPEPWPLQRDESQALMEVSWEPKKHVGRLWTDGDPVPQLCRSQVLPAT